MKNDNKILAMKSQYLQEVRITKNFLLSTFYVVCIAYDKHASILKSGKKGSPDGSVV